MLVVEYSLYMSFSGWEVPTGKIFCRDRDKIIFYPDRPKREMTYLFAFCGVIFKLIQILMWRTRFEIRCVCLKFKYADKQPRRPVKIFY